MQILQEPQIVFFLRVKGGKELVGLLVYVGLRETLNCATASGCLNHLVRTYFHRPGAEDLELL